MSKTSRGIFVDNIVVNQPPTTKQDFQNLIQDAINAGELGSFYKPNDPRVRKLAETASNLVADPAYPINDPFQVADVVRLCLYDIALYCGMHL